MPQRQIIAPRIILVSWHIAYNDAFQAVTVALSKQNSAPWEGTMTDTVCAVSWQPRRELAGGPIAFDGNSLTMTTAHLLRGFERANGRAARLDHALEYSV